MTGQGEWLRWLRDAESAMAGARRGLRDSAWRDATLLAQLAVEMSAKAVVAAFAEPQWTHAPAGQLRAVVLARADAELQSVLGAGARASVEQLAVDADEAVVWHGRAAYGRKMPDGAWQAAVDVCTEEVARDLGARAERSVAVAGLLQRGGRPS